ncbi:MULTISPECIES: Uma2 family endonuclease [Cyanophyceae]|uniref:Uma2 family endonuclease n=1 Tax=Cyanophyceae TaxID=3028117 RepID=UPI00232E148D|nr:MULTISPECIES: Uma2 family endonuclease [Cyanophyceae]MDB9356839.1 Uma2 family endonuclease [Nodularia spumigena CS-587/03]MDB9306753.1 Uma2 family endonuclease [Nodularia spumigena CS-591/12]MDB9319066.1 Uma2 family endonuclease [Nodularia spumigena CS-590/01A]MDB9324440.1 Uma2 family endonuclease [Nodularia spumigena CS-591/07A]MDB9324917.1 Uma2 family endonuclease [Nodularia spumigena CS-590/02]
MNVVKPKRFTIDEYHRLIELGLLTEGDRIELIRGELMQMTAKGRVHTVCSSILCRQLDRLLGDRAVIRGQDPITLPNQSEPEPDIVIARGKDEDYLVHHPYPEDILLVIEISDSTLTYDQTKKLSLYAEAGIIDYWIVNLPARQLERYNQPYKNAQKNFRYLSQQISLSHQSVSIPGFADVLLDLSRIFPEDAADH